MQPKANETDESTLLDQASAGDHAAFGALFERYYTMIYSFAYRLCVSRHDAQDLAQETFIKAARALPSFQGRSSFKNWLYQIAINTNRDWFRSRARKAGTVEQFSANLLGEAEEREADYEPVERSLMALSNELRQAVALVFYEGLSHGEAAKVMGGAEATVSWRIFTAKRKLKQLLTQGVQREVVNL
jgi:RNA polymerase sigma-70 factor (ECF subfamily)